MTILTLTDFSAPADNALAYAAQLAGPMQARLVLLHVRRTSLLDPEAFTGKYPKRTEAEAAALLQERVAQFTGQGIECSGQLVAGGVTDQLVAAAEAFQAQLVVASKCNTEDVPDELVDSTVLSLLRHTPCPLLVVPEAYQRHELPRQWLVATDEQPAHLGALAPAVQALLAGSHPVVHAVQVAVPGDSAAADASLATALGATGPVQVEHGSDVAAALAGFAGQQPGSWLVLWARAHSRLSSLFHHSTTAAAVLHSSVPVLVLPEIAG